MGNLVIATIFVVMLNILMWFSGIAMLNLNPDGSVCYNPEGTIIENVNSGNYTTLDNQILEDLPSSQSTSVVSGAVNFFLDIFNNVLGWFKSAPGFRYVYGVIAAPYNILKCINLPAQFVFGIGTVWYLITLLILIAFMWQRD